jgi:glycosyltransferase involved in cell wall biosynthesis
MRVAFLTTDNRDQFGNCELERPYFGTAPEALLQGFEELGGEIEIHVISCSKQRMHTPERLAANIHFHQPIVPLFGWGRTCFTGCALAVRRLLKDLKPDIVHGQGTERDCAMSAVHSGLPNVLTIHGNMCELQRLGLHGNKAYGHLVSFLETHALRRTAGVFCNSDYTRSLVAPRALKTWLVPNAIRREFFLPPQALPQTGNCPHLLNVGLISPRKRQLEILQAVGDIVRSGHKIHITFVGQLSERSPYSQAFLHELRRAEASGYASHAGFRSTDELISLMDQSQGFIHFPTEEAFGLVVAEALARGLKFFGADLGGIRDISANVPGAELFDLFDNLKESISAWIRAGGKRESESANCIAERYSPNVIATRHLEIYREVLGR